MRSSKLDADCYRAYDTICQNGDLGDLHMATVTGPLAFTKLFQLKLSPLPGLPESIKNAIDQGRDELSLVGLLERGRPTRRGRRGAIVERTRASGSRDPVRAGLSPRLVHDEKVERAGRRLLSSGTPAGRAAPILSLSGKPDSFRRSVPRRY